MTVGCLSRRQYRIFLFSQHEQNLYVCAPESLLPIGIAHKLVSGWLEPKLRCMRSVLYSTDMIAHDIGQHSSDCDAIELDEASRSVRTPPWVAPWATHFGKSRSEGKKSATTWYLFLGRASIPICNVVRKTCDSSTKNIVWVFSPRGLTKGRILEVHHWLSTAPSTLMVKFMSLLIFILAFEHSFPLCPSNC